MTAAASLPRPRRALGRCFAVLLLAGLRAGHFVAQTAPAKHFRISGVVVNAQDAAPVARCRLSANLSAGNRGGNRQQPIEVQSDEHGRFALDLPSAGNWRLTAAGRNIHSQPYDQHESFFTGIVLTDAEPTYNVVFRAAPDAVLAGVVIDEAGEAVRNAPVSLVAVDPSYGPSAGPSAGSSAGPSVNPSVGRATPGLNPRMQQATTDDRGHYEFAGLDAGSYLINVRARPWYALQAGLAASGASSPDPSLDMVYPVTWYPGTTEDASATPVVVHAGDRVEADFHLLAIPSAHLLLPANPNALRPAGGDVPMEQVFRPAAQVSLLLPNGAVQQVFGNYGNTTSGEVDLGGLAPGTYQVVLPGSNPREPGRTTVVHITGGGTTTEVGTGSADNSLTVAVEGNTSVDASQITLVDTATGRTISPGNRRGRPGNVYPGGFGGEPQQRRVGGNGPGAQNPPPVASPSAPPGSTTDVPAGTPAGGRGGLGDLSAAARQRPVAPDVTVDLPPGRYEVIVPGNSGAFLTGLTATGAQAEGRFVTLRDGAARLVVHLAAGLATVDGVARFHGRPDAGALVLLIPATLGSPTSLAVIHRDQSNTDGGFRLAGVIPGQYILVAIDHGWAVHWSDPAALRPYLLGGTPLDLAPAASAHSDLQAVAP